MLTSFARERFYPFYLILITIVALVSTLSPGDDDAFPVFKQNGGASNVPIRTCDSSSQLKYADLTTVHLSPHCDRRAQGFCGLHRNQNYTLMVKFSPKVSTKRLSVQVTTIDPTFGWETPLWPEFSVCSTEYNITCPQTPNNPVEAVLFDSLPKELPMLRTLVRIRLLGWDEKEIKRVYICRQINLDVK